MSASALIDRARACGFAVRLDDDTGPYLARVREGAILPVGFVAELKAARAAVVAFLKCRGCGQRTDEKGRCWKCQRRPCVRCDGDTGSILIATCVRCGAAD
jgi:hypothetical protein